MVYVPGNLQLFLDDLENPLMTVYVNLAKVMDLDNGRAWVGFTAATGADWQNQDLIRWIFDSPEDAIQYDAQTSTQTQITESDNDTRAGLSGAKIYPPLHQRHFRLTFHLVIVCPLTLASHIKLRHQPI